VEPAAGQDPKPGHLAKAPTERPVAHGIVVFEDLADRQLARALVLRLAHHHEARLRPRFISPGARFPRCNCRARVVAMLHGAPCASPVTRRAWPARSDQRGGSAARVPSASPRA
jgi:hypothetical protein